MQKFSEYLLAGQENRPLLLRLVSNLEVKARVAGKKGTSKKSARKAYRKSAAYLKKGPKKK